MAQKYMRTKAIADEIVLSYRKLFRYPKLFKFKDFASLRRNLLELHKNDIDVDNFVNKKMERIERKLYKVWMQQADQAEDEVLYIKRRDCLRKNQETMADMRASQSALKHLYKNSI